MPKILITGNGFDLSVGLPTTYSDFMQILRFSEVHGISDFESVYSNCTNYQQIQSTFKKFTIDESNVSELKALMSSNIWYTFFKTEYEIDSWIDFENKIEYVLKNLFTSIENIKKNVFKNGSLEKNAYVFGANIFNGKVEIIEVLKSFKIISTREGIYDIKINDDYLILKYGHYIDIDIDKITKMLIKELIVFKMIFNLYFETFIFPLYQGMSLNMQRGLFSTINKHYTFNYTPTFEKIFRSGCKTSFLHGRIDSKNNKIVLGINEIPNNENIDKKYFLPFTKYFQKFNNGTDYTFLQEFVKNKRNNFQFFFWGHSLDRSDEDYINEVFDFIDEITSPIKKIIVIYHTEESKESLLLNLLNIRGKKNIQDLMRNSNLVFYILDSVDLDRELKKDITRTTISVK